ncbi:MAG: hypothetical protein ACLP5H_33555 [Desulfomonilaceae bacterium]
MNQTGETNKSISFRSQLTGDIHEFCFSENVTCGRTVEAIVQLVSSLSDYREEGLSLYPDVYICSDISRMCSMLQGGDFIEIGSGSISDETVKQALKKCAMLAINSWAIFLERSDTQLKYGLFNYCKLPLSVSPVEILITPGDTTFPIIVAFQLASDVVELRGSAGHRLQIQFTPVRPGSPSPLIALDYLSNAITADVQPDSLPPIHAFVNRTLNDIVRQTHGTLVAVVSKKRRMPPRIMRDGVILSPPFSITEKIRRYTNIKNDETMALLLSTESLIKGMLMTDGITLFRSDGSIIAYNIFIKGLGQLESLVYVMGGSRRRTFERMAAMVPNELKAAFIRSHDGQMECKV